MDRPLFRPEAMRAQRQEWLGAISLAQPLRAWVLALALAAAALAVGLFVALCGYTRRARVVGQLVPDLGVATVVAPAAGVVERIDVEEGERVLAGSALALVAAPRATATGADARHDIAAGIDRRRDSLVAADASQAALANTQAAGLRRQLEDARRELAQARAQADARQRLVAMAREAWERYRDLGAQDYVSREQVRQQEQAWLEQVGAQRELLRQAATLERQLAQIEQSLQELPTQRAAQAAATARELALLDRERVQNAADGEFQVKAPVSGLLASRLVEPGQPVQAGQAIANLLPAGSRLQAQLLVPSRDIGFIRPGDTVLLRYQAYPYQKFGHHAGVVSRISRNALGRAELGGLAGAANAGGGEPYYRVLVDVAEQQVMAYGRPEPLRPGMLLDADILGEHRKLYEWALEPLYSLTGVYRSSR